MSSATESGAIQQDSLTTVERTPVSTPVGISRCGRSRMLQWHNTLSSARPAFAVGCGTPRSASSAWTAAALPMHQMPRIAGRRGYLPTNSRSWPAWPPLVTVQRERPTVYLCIASARRELPLLPRSGRLARVPTLGAVWALPASSIGQARDMQDRGDDQVLKPQPSPQLAAGPGSMPGERPDGRPRPTEADRPSAVR
jgi:hypothetical protein